MDIKSLTRDMVRDMADGATATYRLPTNRALESARVTAYSTARLEGFQVSTQTDMTDRTITITKTHANNN